MTVAQPAIPGVPVDGNTPQAYVTQGYCQERLLEFYGLTAVTPPGILLAASLALDEEGPFMGVKFVITQERQWPRTFQYGWPNEVAAPSPIFVDVQFPGAFYLDYEQVVPQQVVDWTCLEAWRMVTLPMDRGVKKESVTGASITYDETPFTSQLDRIQAALLSPFQLRQGHTNPFPNLAGS